MDVNISNNNINLVFSENDEDIKYSVPKNKKLVVNDDGTMKVIDKRSIICDNESCISFKYEKINYILKPAWRIEFLSNCDDQVKIPSLWVYDNTNNKFLYDSPKTMTIIPKKCAQIKMIDPSNESIINIENLLN